MCRMRPPRTDFPDALGTAYRNGCVADLAWAVASPPLLLLRESDCAWYDGDWFLDQYRQIETRLRALDRDPVRLESLLQAEKDQRLGNYFETLWAYALELHPRYRLIARNLQIIDGGRTLGEMDFIVRDNETGRYAHWELAIKFYLGVGDTARLDAWHGPGRKDRLDLKVDHLLGRQTLLSTHPVARAVLSDRGIDISECAVILKGRLFYPSRQRGPDLCPKYAGPSHLTGRWLTRRAFLDAYGAEARLMPLIRQGWMSDEAPDNDRVCTIDALLQRVDRGQYRLPLQVSLLAGASERERVFIVDSNWPDFFST